MWFLSSSEQVQLDESDVSAGWSRLWRLNGVAVELSLAEFAWWREIAAMTHEEAEVVSLFESW